MELHFSFVIPVYNRPQEIRELFNSMRDLEGEYPYEIVLVEDGSTRDASQVVEEFRKFLPITYLVKPNSGPGDSRNYGMKRAKGNYFIILDSDCLLPAGYLKAVKDSLSEQYVDCYGGPDRAHASFSTVQKAVDYAMTALLTTGGIRGGGKKGKRFEPRSFNMGLSKKAFLDTGGFGNIHPGEDPDLSIRLRDMGYSLGLIPEAFVYHKRRISFGAFFRQVRKFGKVRPILNHWHPQSARITYWFPTAFMLGLLVAFLLPLLLAAPLGYIPLGLYGGYFLVLLGDAWKRSHSFGVACLSVWAVILQFTAYGLGFLESTILVTFSNKKPREVFPELFF